jgi:hypothetical protein
VIIFGGVIFSTTKLLVAGAFVASTLILSPGKVSFTAGLVDFGWYAAISR